jgi:hypothetical protein
LAHGLPDLEPDGPPTAGGPRLDDHNTQAGLADSGVACPAVTAELVAVYLNRLVRDGLLPPPPARPGPAPEFGHVAVPAGRR